MLPYLDRPHGTPGKCLRISNVVPALLLLAITIILFLNMGEAPSAGELPSQENKLNVHFNCSAKTTYFLQSLASTDPSTFDPSTTDFGLIPQAYDSDVSLSPSSQHSNWQRFVHHVGILNEEPPPGTSYHIVFLTRHGQGFHNLAESYYGTEAWDCYYAALDGDPKSSITWSDARLSNLGRRQADDFAKFWKTQHVQQGTPQPEAWFASPLDRAIETASILLNRLLGGKLRHGAPIIKEKLREELGIHTCDRRSTRSEIETRWGSSFKIEKALTQRDKLWNANIRETSKAHSRRVTLLLDEVFGTGDVPVHLAMTAHGGAINAILRAVGHREFQLGTGSGMPMLLKVERVEGKRPDGEILPPGDQAPTCINDPLKAGLPGYKSFEDYVKQSESSIV